MLTAATIPTRCQTFHRRLWSCGLIALALVTGCGRSDRGPNLIGVRGQVTMDGRPLPDASLSFVPKSGGRAAFGMTDSAGWYRLGYSKDLQGAPEGEYIVSISTAREPQIDSRTGAMTPAVKEVVPAVYNSKSTLSVTIPGSAESLSFSLKSDAGEILQPYAESD